MFWDEIDLDKVNTWPKAFAAVGGAFALAYSADIFWRGDEQGSNRVKQAQFEEQKAESEERKAELELKKLMLEKGVKELPEIKKSEPKKDGASNDNSWHDRHLASEKAKQLVASTWVR